LLRGAVADGVSRLREHSDGVLAIIGSGELIGSLMAADLID
jgi:dihydrofolate reductase